VALAYDVIVAGVGSMGAATCMSLAQRGARVLGLEQFDIPHRMGAHHGHSRMVRQAYFEHPDYVPLLRHAMQYWQRLHDASDLPILRRTGGLYMGRPDGAIVSGSAAASRTHGLDHELLDRKALAERYPQFHVPQDFAALYESAAGIVFPEHAVSAQVDQALRCGAEIRAREAVVDWSPNGAGVEVRTDRNTYSARQVIFTAGAWTGRLVRDLTVPLTVTRQTLVWLWPAATEPFEPANCPVWLIEIEPDTGYYGMPLLQHPPGIKMALHRAGETVDPDHVCREVSEDELRPLLDFAAKYLPDASGPVLSSQVCLYTHSPDSHFIIDRHPGYPQVFLACGFSGHGFKFCGVVGEALADFALIGRTELPVHFLHAGRFT